MSVKSENVFIKKIENKINNFSMLSEIKNKRIVEKRQMSHIVDKILIRALQDFEQYYKLNPINIKIDESQIISSLSKYRKYRLRITSLLISASFNQTTDVIFITCNGLNEEENNGKTEEEEKAYESKSENGNRKIIKQTKQNKPPPNKKTKNVKTKKGIK